jgi:hypothetical protein
MKQLQEFTKAIQSNGPLLPLIGPKTTPNEIEK